MYQVWMNDRLYGVWSDKHQVQLVKAMLEAEYPSAKIEIRKPS